MTSQKSVEPATVIPLPRLDALQVRFYRGIVDRRDQVCSAFTPDLINSSLT
jgi:hypothetical protein